MTVGELARVLMIKNHSALGLVDRLVERQLLRRAPSPLDRRRVELTLTDLGRQKLETISRNNLGQLQTSMPVFADLLKALEQLDLPKPETPPEPPEPSAKRPRRAVAPKAGPGARAKA